MRPVKKADGIGAGQMILSRVARRGALGLLLGFGLLAGPIQAGQQAGPAGEPEATVTAFHDALDRGDGATVVALLAEDAVIFEEGYVERSKSEYVEGHLPADMKFSAAVASTTTSRQTTRAQGMAVVLTESTMRGDFAGKAVDRISIETMVLRRDRAGWRIIHIH